MKDDVPLTPGRVILAATRIWLPLAIGVGGAVLIVLGHGSLSNQAGGHALEAASGVALLVVAVIVWMVNWLFRMSVDSNRDREVEEEAREYFDRHGYWPDEEPR